MKSNTIWPVNIDRWLALEARVRQIKTLVKT